MRILLLHAFPLDERMWEPQVAALYEHDVVTPNLYALGGSSIEQWAMSLLRDVWGEAVLVGASMGGYVALAFARMAPERVRGLVLVGARADADSPERRDARMQTIGQIQERGAEGAVLAMSAVLESEPAAATKLAIAREQQPEALVNAQRAMRDRPDLTDVVKALQAPQLVVVGESDPLFPPDEAKALAAAAANGRAAVIEGAGHLPSLEQPDAFNDELLGFVASLE